MTSDVQMSYEGETPLIDERTPSHDSESWEVLSAGSASVSTPEVAAVPAAVSADANPETISVAVTSPPSTISPVEDIIKENSSQSSQWQPRNLHDTAAILSRDVAQKWYERNYLFYLMDVKTCIGSRACERSVQHAKVNPESPPTNDDTEKNMLGGHMNSDWYGALAGHRSSSRDKIERAEAIASLSDSQHPSLCFLDAKYRSSLHLMGRVPAHYSTTTYAPVEMEEDSQGEPDDFEDKRYVYKSDDCEESSDGSEEDDFDSGFDEDAEHGKTDNGLMFLRMGDDQQVHETKCAAPCAGYVPTQWLDFKPVWIRVRAHLLQAAPTILAAQETVFLDKIHWILHNVYHSCCIPGHLQDLFQDFLGLAPPSLTTPGCDKCVVVNGEIQCPAKEHSIERSSHWMMPRELWSSLLLDMRAFAGNTVSVVILNVDGVKGQAIGVGGFDGPSSARFYFEAHLHESLVLTSENNGHHEDDESEDAKDEEQIVESHILIPCGPNATDRPLTAFSVKWAHAL